MNLLIVFAFAGDSTITRFLAIMRNAGTGLVNREIPRARVTRARTRERSCQVKRRYQTARALAKLLRIVEFTPTHHCQQALSRSLPSMGRGEELPASGPEFPPPSMGGQRIATDPFVGFFRGKSFAPPRPLLPAVPRPIDPQLPFGRAAEQVRFQRHDPGGVGII